MEQRSLFLWLIPEPRQQDDLESVIREISSRYGGPAFSPHVTLLSGIPDEADATDRCRSLAESCAPLDLEVLHVGHRDEYFRALFLELRLSRPLLEARMQAEHIFSAHSDSRFFPHLSLAYGSLSAAQATSEHGLILAKLPHSLKISTLALVSATEGLSVESWKQLCTFPLGGHRS
jgi:hypothetical protein